MAASAIYPGALKSPVTRLQNSDSTNFVQILAAAVLGTKVETICGTTDDTTAVILQLCVTNGGIDYVIGEVTLPIGSGTNGVAKAVNLLNTTDFPWLRNDGINNYLWLENGYALKVKAKTAITAGKFVYLYTQSGEY